VKPDDDPYRPPSAPLADVAPGGSTLLGALRDQSTWRLVGLALVTYGVYGAYYCRRQAQVLNEFLPPEDPVSDALSGALIVTNWLSLLLFFPYLLVEEGHFLEPVSAGVDLVSNVLFIVWGFAARRRMNGLLTAQPGEPGWFHGLWTFLFSPFYFNYKVNRLGDAGVPSPERDAPDGSAGGVIPMGL